MRTQSNFSDTLSLSFGFGFEDLYQRAGLKRLDEVFCRHLAEAAPELAERLTAARQDPRALAVKQESELMLEVAPHLEDFIGELFGIGAELRALHKTPLHRIQRRQLMMRLLQRAQFSANSE